MDIKVRSRLAILLIFLSGCVLLENGPDSKLGFISLDDGVEIYYEDHGNGQPLILVPGYTFGGDVFAAQVRHFSDSHRVVVIDPRGQGRSTNTDRDNTYRQHGNDLAVVLQALKVSDPVLIGWSNGCRTLWEYFRLAGTSKTKAVACIDGAPVLGIDCDDDWYSCKVDRIRNLISVLKAGDRPGWSTRFSHVMLNRQASDAELEWLVSEQLKTSTEVALQLANSMLYDDYRQDLATASMHVPVLYFAQQSRSQQTSRWLSEHAPGVVFAEIANHLAIWDQPEQINAPLEQFLQSLPDIYRPYSTDLPNE